MQSASLDLLDAWEKPLSGLSGPVSLHLRSAGQVVAQRRPDHRHYAASNMKLAVLGTLLQTRSRSGFARQLVVTDQFTSAVGGGFTLLQADDQDDLTWARLGEPVEVDQLAERMIVLSSNLATDLLLSELGFEPITRFLAGAGLSEAVVVRRLIGDSSAEASGISNTVTAAGLARLLEGLTDCSLLDADDTRTATQVLAGQTHKEMIPAGLPSGTWSASKGGWVDGVNHDVALVRPESAPDYVLAICTSAGLSHDAGCALVAELSRITWEHWNRWHS